MKMKLTTVMFDLDGTLLPMDLKKFTDAYFKLLATKLAPVGYKPEELVAAVWSGTAAMAGNDGSTPNCEVFWRCFGNLIGARAIGDRPLFDSFYAVEFAKAADSCGFNPQAAQCVRLCKSLGLRTVLATNPVFPAVATEQRIRWAGLEPKDFELITTYENSSFCKPSVGYYSEILGKIHAVPAECLMVGNDTDEDMVAEKAGLKVFLLTDCLINRSHTDISCYPNGDFTALEKHIKLLSETNS